MFTDFEAIQIGETRSLTKRISEADVRKFVEMTGDDNPLHVDRHYAETTAFKDIVVHGMLGASFISTVIGTQLPGHGALWVSQNMEFLLPVRLNDELVVACTVIKKHERERLLELRTTITNQNQQLVLNGTGKVKVLVPRVAPEPVSATEDRTKVALISGASGGIGRAISLRLAADGFAVVVNYSSNRQRAEELVQEIIAQKGQAVAVQADISNPLGAEALVKAAVTSFGAVDILINNASARINPKPFSNTEWADLQAHLDVGVKGAFLLSKACMPGMAERKWGRIVNITSQVTDGSPSIGWSGYAVAKSALSMLSRYIAAEYGPSNVTVNCVSPGMTETSLIGDIPEKVQMMIARQTPLRRLATPKDVAAAVAYLVSEEAAYVTGHTLNINGGMVMR